MKQKTISVTDKLKCSVALALVGAALSGTASAETVLKLAHASSSDSLINQAVTHFADAVSKESGGEMTIRIYPDGQLGDEGAIAESVGTGALDIGLGGVVDPIDPRLNVVSLPFLFKNAEHVHAFLDGEGGKTLKAMGQDHGYKILSALDSGFRQFSNSKHPIETPEDLEGLKIRTPPNPVILSTIKALGGLPTSISFGEVYTALQSGVVDGVEPELRDFYDQKWNEVNNLVSMSNYIWSANYWFMNNDTYNALSADEQAIVDGAVKETETWYRGQLDAVYARLTKELTEKGVAFNTVNTASFKAKVQPVYDQFAEEWGQDFVQTILDEASE